MFFKNEKKKPTEFENLLEQNKKKEKMKKENVDVKWVVRIVVISFIISFCLSFVANVTIPNFNIVLGCIITLLFIFIGIVFDIIGVYLELLELLLE